MRFLPFMGFISYLALQGSATGVTLFGYFYL